MNDQQLLYTPDTAQRNEGGRLLCAHGWEVCRTCGSGGDALPCVKHKDAFCGECPLPWHRGKDPDCPCVWCRSVKAAEKRRVEREQAEAEKVRAEAAAVQARATARLDRLEEAVARIEVAVARVESALADLPERVRR